MTDQSKVVAKTTAPRIYGFDVWRAGLLIGGPLFHADGMAQLVTGYKGAALHDLAFVSTVFRMQAFFMIAGYLAAHTRQKQGSWYERRLVQLGVPLAFTWIAILIPAGLIAKQIYSQQPNREGWGYSPWCPEHLWFLITLIGCHTVVSLFARTDVSRRLAFCEFGPRSALCAWTVILACLTIFSEAISLLVRAGPLNVLVRTSAHCVGAYFFGFQIMRSHQLARFLRDSRVGLLGPLALVAVVAANHFLITAAASPPSWQTHILVAGLTGIATTLMCVALFHSAARMTSRPKVVASLSDASYSIYLLHFPIIMLLGTLRFLSASTPFAAFGFMAATSLVLSFLIHEMIVKRSPAVAFLLNGKKGRKKVFAGSICLRRAGEL